mgnify:CR=1 FL=1
MPPTDKEATAPYVTWKALVATLITLSSFVFGIGWVAWQVHASQPHIGAAHHRDIDGIEERLTRIETKIDKMLTK